MSAVSDGSNEDVEEMFGVSRAWRGLGVELDGEPRAYRRVNSLVGTVVGVLEQLSPADWQRRGIDFVSVVLRGLVASSTESIGTGDIVTSVAVLHLLGLSPCCKGQQLVTKTNTEDGDSLSTSQRQQLPDVGNGRCTRGWVTWTVRDEETVKGLRLDRGVQEVVVPRDNLEFDSTAGEASDLIVLHTDIEGQDSDRSTRRVGDDGQVASRESSWCRIGRRVQLRCGARHSSDQVDLVWVGKWHVDVRSSPVGAGIDGSSSRSIFSLGQELSEHAALVPNSLGQGSSVDSVDGGDSILLEPVSKAACCEPMAVVVAVRGHDETGNVNSRGLKGRAEESMKRLGGLLSRWYTVVADQGVREHQDLALVRRIGERLDVTDHTCRRENESYT